MDQKAVIENNVLEAREKVDFSGVVIAKEKGEVLFEAGFGYANRAEETSNELRTRFGIASGCKLFTAISICQLVDAGKLSFDTKLKDCLDVSFPAFDPNVTVHQLLTHSSGVPDYFDEEVMDDFEDLWKQQPMYLLRELKDFLPLFQNEEMKGKPGEEFSYNNSGYILLGLIIEQQTGVSFTDYVEKNVFEPSGMENSGYFSMDRLPRHTALGYIDEEDGTWRTNTYALPVKGGSDGGAYVTAPDMILLWEALLEHKLLSKKMTETLLQPHIVADEEEGEYYGYGVWIEKRDNDIAKYHVMGYDPGVCFHSAFYPQTGLKVVVASNKGEGAYTVNNAIEEALFGD
ncbi:serine hydrolase domain-containing protein [Bacillus horti]|uniref:CubicO group peptidase (Beta-lactamase class C family) n=1 Tax=Caldalkalibacillus horti TaxID=77523 RepID=A0ABT9VXX5_9BACI|nr:serine hydrolase [Bacillus horti]MDQ0165848.1 CubicO group peptidase (beta-lactamase class C family) [Bacillus horti]